MQDNKSTIFFYLRFKAFSFFILFTMVFALGAPLNGAPRRYPSIDDNLQVLVNEFRDKLDYLRHEMSNQDAEVRVFEEKLNTYELTIDGLRQQLTDMGRINQQLIKDRTEQLENRVTTLESYLKGLVADMQQFKMHSQDTSNLIIQSQRKIDELERGISIQNKNLESLQAALGSLMEMMQVGKEDTVSSKTYKVRSGDRLEKIAREHQVSISELKRLNNLKDDKIIVGQTLKLP
jgi:LysM repeat protein